MSVSWNSLFCPFEDAEAIIRALQDSLTASGYELYNPFTAFPGKSYSQTIRLFVAPASAGWTRVLGASEEAQLRAVSALAPCLYLQLDGADAAIIVYKDGQPAALDELAPYTRAGANLTQAMNNPDSISIVSSGAAKGDGLPFDSLPADIQAMASGVDKGAAEKMFNRLSGQLMKKVGGDDSAKSLLSNEGAPDWNSVGGKQIRALMAALTVPDNWREPDFTALRDAYPLHERRRSNPNARLYPGDDAIMNAVPDALAYTPVYGGKNA